MQPVQQYANSNLGLLQPYYPTITTSGTTNIYYQPPLVAQAAPEPELGPLEWLRGQVDEVCELAAAA